jgi:hypothetical protein
LRLVEASGRGFPVGRQSGNGGQIREQGTIKTFFPASGFGFDVEIKRGIRGEFVVTTDERGRFQAVGIEVVEVLDGTTAKRAGVGA